MRNDPQAYLPLDINLNTERRAMTIHKFSTAYKSLPILLLSVALPLLALLSACQQTPPMRETMQPLPTDSLRLSPDYAEATIPPNIAPLHFRLTTAHEGAFAIFSFGEEKVVVKEKNSQFSPPAKAWRRLLAAASGREVSVWVCFEKQGKWFSFEPFLLHVAPEDIDAGLVYRRIAPGYELWHQMGIYKRDLASFRETTLLENKHTKRNCMNCHSFCEGNPEQMLYHMRGSVAGTFLQVEGQTERIDTHAAKQHLPLTYPVWHPQGDFLAFTSADTKQSFHMNHANRIEVFDLSSDIVLYDVRRKETFSTPLLASARSMETFPAFAPDGKTLYFCSADTCSMPEAFDEVRYHLCAIAFDPKSRTFGSRVDTLYNATEKGSVSFPRVSPDGMHLVYTLSDYGQFSIWHKEADLYLVDLKTGEHRPLEAANSGDVESYHSWSRNSRWLVFSSRRDDGLYTRPYIAYISEEGVASKPFLLPQSDVDYYDESLYSFNIPELVREP